MDFEPVNTKANKECPDKVNHEGTSLEDLGVGILAPPSLYQSYISSPPGFMLMFMKQHEVITPMYVIATPHQVALKALMFLVTQYLLLSLVTRSNRIPRKNGTS
jgi:hypothetical protein